MDVKNEKLEQMCICMRKVFSSYFDWNIIDINYSKIDTVSKEIFTISSDYEWVLMYWEHDLDLLLNERLTAGYQFWNNYSEIHSQVLSKKNDNLLKVDVCIRYDEFYEIFSISSHGKLPIGHLMEIYQWRPIISDYIHCVWSKHKDIVFPLRAPNTWHTTHEADEYSFNDNLLDVHKFMRFGNVVFTQKEMLTIRLLLSQCKVKEISAIQGCSVDREQKRILNIKEKLGCSHMPPSRLFKQLKEKGITLACLDNLINYPLNRG
ncbi:hypothetical protein RZ760_012170 [Providencia rettgeri]|nr:hypothetical protein [Providencia rettgeri]